MASSDDLSRAISAIPLPIATGPPPVHDSRSRAGFVQIQATPRLSAVLGLICLAVTAVLCLVAFLSYRRHAERVLEDNVAMAKGMGAAGGMALFPALLGNARAAEDARLALESGPMIALEAPPVARWCLVAAVPFAVGAVACFFVLGNLTPVLVGMLSGAWGLASGAVAAVRAERAHRDNRPPSPPTDLRSLPKFPGS